MDHLKKLHRSCHTCDYYLPPDRALCRGWVAEVEKGARIFCTRTRTQMVEPRQECPCWLASYDGYDALSADDLPNGG